MNSHEAAWFWHSRSLSHMTRKQAVFSTNIDRFSPTCFLILSCHGTEIHIVKGKLRVLMHPRIYYIENVSAVIMLADSVYNFGFRGPNKLHSFQRGERNTANL